MQLAVIQVFVAWVYNSHRSLWPCSSMLTQRTPLRASTSLRRCCCADQSQASKVHESDAGALQVSEAASLIAAAAAEAPTRPGLSSAAAAAAKDKANQLIAELYNGLGLAEAVPGALGGEGHNGRPKGKGKTKGKYAQGVRAWAGGFNVTGRACCGRLQAVVQDLHCRFMQTSHGPSAPCL